MAAMNPMAMAVPALSVLPFAVLAAMPWSAPDAIAFGLPLITLAAIHFWSVRAPALLPSTLVFVIGLLVDLVTDGPLGFWGFLYLVGHAFGAYVPVDPAAAGRKLERGGSFLAFAAMLAVVTGFAWLIASVYFLLPFDLRPFVGGALLALVCWPMVAYVMEPLTAILTQGDEHHLSYGESRPNV